MVRNKYDRSHWHYVQAPEEMFLLRRHDFNDDARYLLGKWLNLERPSLKIVEMGSGSGYFTQQLLKIANQPHIICVEPDDMLMDFAKETLGRRVSFMKGFVEESPLAKDSADVVICHVLLCNMPDIKAAVKSMVEVAKPGGIVCSIEPVFLGGYSPDPRAKLIVEGHSANIEGAWIRRKELIDYPDEYPYDKYVYPRIFAECSLSKIEVHALASSYYSGDWRRKKEDITKEAKEWLDLLDKHEERYKANLRRVGWDETKIGAFFRAWRERHEEEIRNPSMMIEEHSVNMKCNIVTIGQKQLEREVCDGPENA